MADDTSAASADRDRIGLVVVEDIAKAYDFGEGHPLRPERVLITYERIRGLGLTSSRRVIEIPSRSAGDPEILAVHDEDFVATVKGIDSGDVEQLLGLEYGLGTPDDPIFDGMHRASAAVAGASIVAAEAVATGRVEHAFNPAGGLHHARRREASGFCIYNDPAAAIAKVLEIHPEWRVLYLDVDVHHGDGVQWIFYEDPRVLTVSLHESGRYLYPGTGFEEEIGVDDALGSSVNVPLPPYTGDADYLWALDRVLPAVADAFRPDLIVTQLGGDTHHGDPLAHLALTMRAYPKIARLIHEVAGELCDNRWVATGGGGYQAETVVPRIWTIHFAEMCDSSDLIPLEWLNDLAPEDVSRPARDVVEPSVETVLAGCLPRLRDLAAVD
jgi:acetoin utilization protein AcuC